MFSIVNINFSSHLLDRTLDMIEAIAANDGGDAQSSEITTFKSFSKKSFDRLQSTKSHSKQRNTLTLEMSMIFPIPFIHFHDFSRAHHHTFPGVKITLLKFPDITRLFRTVFVGHSILQSFQTYRKIPVYTAEIC